VFDASVVEGVKYVGDVAAMEVGSMGVDDEGAGYGELFADEAAALGAFGGVSVRGVDSGEADALTAGDLEAEVDVEQEGVGVDDVADFGFVEVAWIGGARDGEGFAFGLF
jgi:hypothetical protein